MGKEEDSKFHGADEEDERERERIRAYREEEDLRPHRSSRAARRRRRWKKESGASERDRKRVFIFLEGLGKKGEERKDGGYTIFTI